MRTGFTLTLKAGRKLYVPCAITYVNNVFFIHRFFVILSVKGITCLERINQFIFAMGRCGVTLKYGLSSYVLDELWLQRLNRQIPNSKPSEYFSVDHYTQI
jgi:hypothetical protein